MNDTTLPKLDSARRIKSTLNTWLLNKNGENPPPLDSTIRAVTIYQKSKVLIKTNSHKSATWLRKNVEKVLQLTIGHPIEVLCRSYAVIAHFMPVTFQENNKCKCKLKLSANLLPKSISRITWIKDPNHRKPGQQFANVKIQCKDANTANSLILGLGHINYLGSLLCLHKDTKDHNACNQCQKYSHIASGCKEEQFTCSKCGGDHKTWECMTNRLKCTPCRASDHRTNDEKCPKRIEHSNIYCNRMPKAFTPYFLTSEKWTWGLANNDPQTHTQAST